MCRPSADSNAKATQWSNASIWLEATEPSSQPMTRVMASTTPKMRPARSASAKRGLAMPAPFPRAAAKAIGGHGQAA